MATTIEQQVALDEALVPSTQRLRIGRSNFRLPSDNQSKESTLQVIYDVLRRCPFFKAFLVTADVPEIYMQEFWATAYAHQYSIRFKMDSKKNTVDLETFKDMLHIYNSMPSGIENFGYDSEGDIRFLEELLIDDSIPLPNNESFDFEDDSLFPRPPLEPPDIESFFDLEPDVIAEEISDELNEDN
nr:hypothetical protein [Tanacetum cinerariifolium]